MAEKLLISFRIKAIDDFSKTMKKLDSQLENIKRQAKSAAVLQKVEFDLDGKKLVKDVEKATKDAQKAADKNKVEPKFSFNKATKALTDFVADYRKSIARWADLSRDVGEMFQGSLTNAIVALAPLAIPAIASIGGALGGLIPIIGTVGGAVMGLGTSFGLAAAGAGAFAALGVSAMKDVFEVSSDLAELQKELANTKDVEERKKIMEEIKALQSSLNAEQQKGLASLTALKNEWGKISTALEPTTINTFVIAMDTLRSLLQRTAPMFESVAKHAQNLMKWLSQQIDTSDFNAFVGVLNTSVGPAFETVGKAASNFIIGFMNLMTAFTPLAEDMNNGLLGISERFREWTASLAGSETFNNFIDYVRENGPKILEIIGNIVEGLVGMGTAFAPFAEDMLDGLVQLTEQFAIWGQTLSENQAFQNFISYVQENGPKLLEFLGKTVELLVNFGIAMAPLADKVLDLALQLVDLANEFVKNNEFATLVIGTIGWLTSVFALLYPVIALVWNILKKLWPVVKTVIEWVKKAWNWIGKWSTKLSALTPVISRVISFLVRFSTPIGALISIVILAATVIYQNWDDIKKWTEDLVKKIIRFFVDLSGDIANLFSKAKEWFSGFTDIDLYESGKKIIQSAIDGLGSMIGAVKKKVSSVAGAIRDFFPFSPAKEGPLSDLNKLDFAGPVGDSIAKNRPAVHKAMESLFTAPDIALNPRAKTYAARSNNYRNTEKQAEQLAVALGQVKIESSGVYMSDREVGRATWRTTTRESKRSDYRVNKFKGVSALTP